MKKLTLATAVALLCAPMLVSAARAVDPGDATIDNVARLNAIVNAGYGVSYKARINVDLNAYKYMNQIIFKTDDLISPAGAPTGEVFKVPAVPSMGWNDVATNPDIPACSATVLTNCLAFADLTKLYGENKAFGWGHSANWYLLDLNALAATLKTASVHIMVEQYNDGVATETSTSSTGVVTTLPSDDDLIPALTVWIGDQDKGTHTHWFPNKHQATAKFDGTAGTEFWARKLAKPTWTVGKKTYELKGASSMGVGYDTAFGTASQKTATVEGVFVFNKKDPSKNFLTFALGGDNRHALATSKHTANYKVTIEVHKPGM